MTDPGKRGYRETNAGPSSGHSGIWAPERRSAEMTFAVKPLLTDKQAGPY